MLKKLGSFVAAFAAVFFTAGMAFAQEGGGRPGFEFLGIAVGLGIGAAALGGTLGQARTAAAALEGISRNPGAADKVFVPMILGLAFIESLVLFTWVLMLLMSNKLA
jgi:F-type H+-transporting ATPase subunit c